VGVHVGRTARVFELFLSVVAATRQVQPEVDELLISAAEDSSLISSTGKLDFSVDYNLSNKQVL